MPFLSSGIVRDIDRCPQCGVATPLINTIGDVTKHYKASYGRTRWYFTGTCSRCGSHTLFNGYTERNESPENGTPAVIRIDKTFPSLESAAQEIPEKVRRFLQQALESKHAPDGAVMLAASAIDSMLKDKGYSSGSLYERIDKAICDHLLTPEMGAWAHEIRLSANEQRHADNEFDGASKEHAEQIIEFSKALGDYLYVLPARVEKWKARALSGD